MAAAIFLAASPLRADEAAPARPIIAYLFNAPGASQASEGSLPDALECLAADGSAMELIGAEGSGVSGGAGDRALDLSQAPDMGNRAPTWGVHARQKRDAAQLDALRSFTLTGWFKTVSATQPIDRYAHLVDNSDRDGGFVLCAGSGRLGNLMLSINKQPAASPGHTYDYAGRWVFFAVTYDSAASAAQVRFYRGFRDEADAQGKPAFAEVGKVDLAVGPVAEEVQALHIGNAVNHQRPMQGWIDNVRIYGSNNDSSGSLDAAALDAIRKADLAPAAAPSP